MNEILNNIKTTAVSVYHTVKKILPFLGVAFELFALFGVLVNVWTNNFQHALYYLGVLILYILIDIRKNSKKSAEVDLRMGSELVAGLVASFLKENPQYKLMKRDESESQVQDETRT